MVVNYPLPSATSGCGAIVTSLTCTPPSGFTFLGQQVNITAPEATPADAAATQKAQSIVADAKSTQPRAVSAQTK